MINCYKCDAEVTDDFCPKCGHPVTLPRLTGEYLASELASIFNVERGFFFTIREMLLRPGANLQEFVLRDRTRFVKPVIFVIVCSFIYTIAQQIFGFEDGYVSYADNEPSTTLTMFTWISNNYGYANIGLALFTAVWVRVFFARYGYTIFEILVMLCYVIGMVMLLVTMGILQATTPLPVLAVGAIGTFFYAPWAIAQFFDKQKWWNYPIAFFCNIAGLLSGTFFVLLLGSTIDHFKGI
ncbi:MAG: DUF3667 domain-containing protein [Pseudomonadota bacterium]